MAFIETMSDIANMSSVYTKKWNNEGEWNGSNLPVGYYNEVLNHRFIIYFTPSINLSSISIKLAANSYNNKYGKNIHYELSEVDTETVLAEGSLAIRGTGSSNAKTATFDMAFEAGKEYSFYVGTDWNEYNAYFGFIHSYITITSKIAYIVNYNANGGTGEPSSQTKTEDVDLTLSSIQPTKSDLTSTYQVIFDSNGGDSSKISETAISITQYTFSEWNTASDGSGTSYNPGDSYTANEEVALYAQWDSSTSTNSVTLPTDSECVRSGYELLGFSIDSSSVEADYIYGSSYTPSKSITLYAIWKPKGCVRIANTSGLYEMYRVYIANNESVYQPYIPHIYTIDGVWVKCI